MKKTIALSLSFALALLFASSLKADGAAKAEVKEAANVSVTVKADVPDEEFLDGSWAVEPYDEHKYNVATANDKAYKAASKAGDWEKAEAYTPLTYVKGWMHLKQARELKYASWGVKGAQAADIDGLKKALVLYTEAKAIGDAATKVDDPRGVVQTDKSKTDGEAIVAQADENIAKITAEIDLLEHPKAKVPHKKKHEAPAKEE